MIDSKKTISGVRLSYGALEVRSNSMIESAKRDTKFLSLMGVTPEFILNFEAKVLALENIEKHKAVVTLKAVSTRERNNTMYDLIIEIKRLRSQAYFAFSITNQHEALFSIGLSRLDATELIEVADNMLTVFNKTDEDIALYGITAERLASFKVLFQKLRNETSIQQQETSAVSIETQLRSELKSEVSKMLEFVSRTGKAYWTKQNEGYYNDYVVNKTKSPPNLEDSEQGTEASQAETEILASNF